MALTAIRLTGSWVRFGGNGKWKGGDGVIREFEFLATLDINILSQHRVEAPYGLRGGKPGKTGKTLSEREEKSALHPDGQCHRSCVRSASYRNTGRRRLRKLVVLFLFEKVIQFVLELLHLLGAVLPGCVAFQYIIDNILGIATPTLPAYRLLAFLNRLLNFLPGGFRSALLLLSGLNLLFLFGHHQRRLRVVVRSSDADGNRDVLGDVGSTGHLVDIALQRGPRPAARSSSTCSRLSH